MMTLTRAEIEALLDTPCGPDPVVTAYADLTVQNGFERHVERHLKNEARAAGDALGGPKARQELDRNIEAIRRAVREQIDPRARGVAVFSCVARGLRQVVALDFPVENRLVVDDEPYVLPILEHWYGEPLYLVALVDSEEAHLFEARHGRPDRVADVVREDAHQEIQRDKPRFTYKKRFAQAWHERLFGLEDDRFLKSAAEAVAEHWKGHDFAGLILLGQPQVSAALKKLLPREVAAAVTGEAPHAMTREPEHLTAGTDHLIEAARAAGEGLRLAALRERFKEHHLVAAGATDVLDALQQGRAVEIFLSCGADIPGARCEACNYRLGAPVRTCPYCDGPVRAVNAVQDILRMAMRHRVPVHTLRHPSAKDDPLAACNGVAAFVRAEANWAPNPAAS